MRFYVERIKCDKKGYSRATSRMMALPYRSALWASRIGLLVCLLFFGICTQIARTYYSRPYAVVEKQAISNSLVTGLAS